jgi:phage shock protein A
MKDSQLKNQAQVQQIERLQKSVQQLEQKIGNINDLVDSKNQGDVLNKIQQIESSKQSLEDLKQTYMRDIKNIKEKIEHLREQIGRTEYGVMSRGVLVHGPATTECDCT